MRRCEQGTWRAAYFCSYAIFRRGEAHELAYGGLLGGRVGGRHGGESIPRVHRVDIRQPKDIVEFLKKYVRKLQCEREALV